MIRTNSIFGNISCSLTAAGLGPFATCSVHVQSPTFSHKSRAESKSLFFKTNYLLWGAELSYLTSFWNNRKRVIFCNSSSYFDYLNLKIVKDGKRKLNLASKSFPEDSSHFLWFWDPLLRFERTDTLALAILVHSFSIVKVS